MWSKHEIHASMLTYIKEQHINKLIWVTLPFVSLIIVQPNMQWHDLQLCGHSWPHRYPNVRGGHLSAQFLPKCPIGQSMNKYRHDTFNCLYQNKFGQWRLKSVLGKITN